MDPLCDPLWTLYVTETSAVVRVSKTSVHMSKTRAHVQAEDDHVCWLSKMNGCVCCLR